MSVAWKNVVMATSLSATATSAATGTARAGDPTRQLLRHIMVVGGTLRDWEQLGDARWNDRVERLGAVSYTHLRAHET